MKTSNVRLLIIGVTGVVFGALLLLLTCSCGKRKVESSWRLGVPNLISMANSDGMHFNLSSAAEMSAFVDEVPHLQLSNTVITRNGVSFIPAMGTIPKPLTTQIGYDLTASTFPSDWSESKQYFSLCRNQQNCGSCWAFATVQVLEDRIDFLTKGRWRDAAFASGDESGGWLSPQYIISCVRDTNERGCQGAGVLEEVIRHLSASHRNGKGVFLSKDYPYLEDSNGEDNQGSACNKPADKPRFNFSSFYAVSDANASKDAAGLKTNIARIKQELMERGPVETSMYVWDSFMKIDSKNNTPSTPYSVDAMGKNKMVGGHAVTIVGWGTIPGKDPSDYKNQWWELRNSWGPAWGHTPANKFDTGYWYWRMGDDLQGFQDGNNIMIEFGAIAGQPDMSHPLIQAVMGNSPGTLSTDTQKWLYGGMGVFLVLIAAGLTYYYFVRK